MDTATQDNLKHELYNANPEFRSLVDAHRKYEQRLQELAALQHPTEKELAEEAEIKVKKLSAKDRIFALLEEHEKGN